MDAKKRHYLNKCAKDVLKFVGSLDPVYEDRIQIARDEHGWDDLQVFGAMVMYVLDHSLHTTVPMNPFFEPNMVAPGEMAKCPHCHGEYEPAYPGQPFDSNECADAYRRMKINSKHES